MPIIDVHAHITPRIFADAIERDGQWHTLGPDVGELHIPKFRISAEEHVADLDRLEVDVHVITANTGFWQVRPRPAGHAGHLSRLQRGAEGESRPVSRPLLRAGHSCRCRTSRSPSPRWSTGWRCRASRASPSTITSTDTSWTSRSSVPSGGPWRSWAPSCSSTRASDTVVEHRTQRYGLANTVGNLTERALTFGALVFGGVMDEFPDLKICLGHAGGYVAFGIARMDKAWQGGGAAEPARVRRRPVLHRSPAQRVPEELLLRLLHPLGGDAALPARHGGSRPRGARHGLAVPDGPATTPCRGSGASRA